MKKYPYLQGLYKMTLKDFWARTSKWLRNNKILKTPDHQPEIDAEGLISRDEDSIAAENAQNQQNESVNNNVIVKAVSPVERTPAPGRANSESIEKLQEGFDKLVKQLEGINEHLERQANQHDDLMGRLKQLPKLLESFPAIVENQKQVTEKLLEQLKGTVAKNEQFVDAVEKIPNETSKQTDALVNIDHQLAAAADIDVQMAENFSKFYQSLENLNQSTNNQTDGILQMSKTFAASDRYLKYMVSKQGKRFMWIFIVAISVCVVVISILAGIIIYLKTTS